MIVKKILIVLSLFFISIRAYSDDLSGETFITITSDTAQNAKNIAFDEARRKIVKSVLLPYSNGALNDVIDNSSNNELTKLILSTNINGEKISKNTYSANIKMTLNKKSLSKWLQENNFDSVFTNTNNANYMFVLRINNLFEWTKINKETQLNNIKFDIKSIKGSSVYVSIPNNQKSKFLTILSNTNTSYSII